MMQEYYWHNKLINSSVIDYIRGMPVIKVFNKTASTLRNLNKTLDDFKSFWMQFVKKTGLPFTSFSVCTDISFLFVLPLGIILSMKGMLLDLNYFCLLR